MPPETPRHQHTTTTNKPHALQVPRFDSRGSLFRGERGSSLRHAHHLNNWTCTFFISFFGSGRKMRIQRKIQIQLSKQVTGSTTAIDGHEARLVLFLLGKTRARSPPCLLLTSLWFPSALGHHRYCLRLNTESTNKFSRPRWSYMYMLCIRHLYYGLKCVRGIWMPCALSTRYE